ncbi:hypothetical protein NM688_g3731 [Phlebia brevispora]|uniref:Uncharacterized protein n=1 Tax=Phlebia brevispora TaxID=194682 RepID=A0ACC1T4P6_9APHY|nr:hypothetical protein NM688_g3731 [Phlebia brevispora]
MLRNPRQANTKNAQEYQDISQVDPWVTIDRKLRGREEDKVHDCRDDMDTLLVFAGLYSAVLVSFLVQSLQNLQENYLKTSVDLLRQITLQTSSYTLTNDHINSTASLFSASSPFEPMNTDVIVNVCWFASLVLSLSTASFGMLVKQWLREYLATDRTAPEERIRILHFRSRGVETWRLFEIAAFLPLVLQLSLALFFVGLCYLASETHPKLRATSLTLVSGWAFLFGLAVLAPLVSARCPYKTTFLKTAFRRIRPYFQGCLISPILRFVRHLSSQLHAGIQQLCSNVCKLCHKLARLLRIPDNESRRQIDIELQQPEENDASRSDNSDHPPYGLPEGVMRILQYYTFDAYIAIPEEDGARASERNDLRIFAKVDGILRDDNLLIAVRGALERRRLERGEVLRFVVSTLHGRLGFQVSDLPDGAEVLKKVRELAPSTCLAFINILSDALRRGDGSARRTYNIISLMLLLGREGQSYLEGMTPVFQHVLSHGELRRRVPVIIRGSFEGTCRSTSAWQIHVFSTLADAFKTLDPSILRSVIHRTYIKANEEPTFESKTYARLLDYALPARSSDETEPQRRVSPEVLRMLFKLVMSILQSMVDGMTDSKTLDTLNISHFTELLQFFFDTFSVMDRVAPNEYWFLSSYPEVRALMKSVFSTPALISILLECLGAHRGFFSLTAWLSILQRPARRAFKSLSASDRANVLAIMTAFFQTKLHSQAPLTTYHILTCAGCVAFRPSSSEEHRAQLKLIFSLIAESLKKASRLPTGFSPSSPSTESEPRIPGTLDEESSISVLANSILSCIDAQSEDGMPSGSAIKSSWLNYKSDSYNARKDNSLYYQWRDLFDIGDSAYSDDLIGLLRILTGGPNTKRGGLTFWRIRRLEDMKRGDYDRRPGTAQDAAPSMHSAASLKLGLRDNGTEAGQGSEELRIPYSGRQAADPRGMLDQQEHGSPAISRPEEPAAHNYSLTRVKDEHTPADKTPKPSEGTRDRAVKNTEPDRTSDVQLGQTEGSRDSTGQVTAGSTSSGESMGIGLSAPASAGETSSYR